MCVSVLTLGTVIKCHCPPGLQGQVSRHLQLRDLKGVAPRCSHCAPGVILSAHMMVAPRRTVPVVTVTWLSVSPVVYLGVSPSILPRKSYTNTKSLVL